IVIVLALAMLLAEPASAEAPLAAKAPAATTAATAPQPETEGSLVGRPAPAFTLADLDGGEHSLSDFAGKIVVLDWYNYACPVVKAYYNDESFMATMNAALENQDDVIWVSIVSSAPGKQGHDLDDI
ncbi:MAG: redoxin domain-containing protein, partial [bacterium]|nr:redoxin domain-containing protein [bacterium]